MIRTILLPVNAEDRIWTDGVIYTNKPCEQEKEISIVSAVHQFSKVFKLATARWRPNGQHAWPSNESDRRIFTDRPTLRTYLDYFPRRICQFRSESDAEFRAQLSGTGIW